MTQTSRTWEKMTKMTFAFEKLALPKVDPKNLCFPSKIKPRRGVSMHAFFRFTSPCQQSNVSQNQHGTENPDISPATYSYCPLKRSSDQSFPQISLRSHTFPRTFEGIGSPKGFCRDNWQMSAIGATLCVLVCLRGVSGPHLKLLIINGTNVSLICTFCSLKEAS